MTLFESSRQPILLLLIYDNVYDLRPIAGSFLEAFRFRDFGNISKPFLQFAGFLDRGRPFQLFLGGIELILKFHQLGTGFFSGVLVADVTVCAVDGGDEAYKIGIELSDNADFSTGSEYETCALRIGDAAVTSGDVDTTTGRFTLPFNNRIVDGTRLRYARVYTTHAGSTSSITYSAFATKA